MLPLIAASSGTQTPRTRMSARAKKSRKERKRKEYTHGRIDRELMSTENNSRILTFWTLRSWKMMLKREGSRQPL